jgi:hypothetical protein
MTDKPDRLPTVVSYAFKTNGVLVAEAGILAPLPASLSQDDLVRALSAVGVSRSNFAERLRERLLTVTGRHYVVRLYAPGWERKDGAIVYEPYQVLDAP